MIFKCLEEHGIKAEGDKAEENDTTEWMNECISNF